MVRIFVAAVVGALLLSLAGCSFFPDPPVELVAAAEQYAAEVRALPGVKAAEATVSAIDAKDRSGQWRVQIVVDTISADGLGFVHSAVISVRPPSSTETRIVVRAPSAPGLAAVTVSNAATADIVRAQALRKLPFARSVSLSYGEFVVAVYDRAPIAEAVAGVRAAAAFTLDPLDSVEVGYIGGRVAVDVSSVGPSDEVVELIESLDGDSDIEHVVSSEPSAQSARPRLAVNTDEPSSVVDTLVAFTEPDVAARPRTAFSVSGGDDYISGYLGLPLDSAEPDDLPPPKQPPGLDPAVLAEQLAADTTSVTEFLGTTVESSGIPGTPEIFVGECTEQEVSGQVGGHVVLEVFAYEASAERAYEAIVTAWEAAGYAHTDQATGTSIFTPSHPRGVVQLSIRGTAEGIDIWAEGACRG